MFAWFRQSMREAEGEVCADYFARFKSASAAMHPQVQALTLFGIERMLAEFHARYRRIDLLSLKQRASEAKQHYAAARRLADTDIAESSAHFLVSLWLETSSLPDSPTARHVHGEIADLLGDTLAQYYRPGVPPPLPV